MLVRNEAPVGKNGSSSANFRLFIAPETFCAQQPYGQPVLTPGNIVGELVYGNPAGFVRLIDLQLHSLAPYDFDTAVPDGHFHAWALSQSVLPVHSFSSPFKEVCMGVVRQIWVQQRINGITQPDSQIVAMHCVGNYPQIDSDSGIEASQGQLATIA